MGSCGEPPAGSSLPLPGDSDRTWDGLPLPEYSERISAGKEGPAPLRRARLASTKAAWRTGQLFQCLRAPP